MPTRDTIIQALNALVGGIKVPLGVGDQASFVDLAKHDVDRYQPRSYRVVLTGDGTDEYALASPWERGFSVLEQPKGVRWVPTADYNAPPIYLLPELYVIDEESDGDPQIRFLSVVPASTDKVDLRFSVRHTLTTAAATTTVNDTQAAALARRAAAMMLRAVASALNSTVSQNTDQDFAGPAIESAAAEYRRLAEGFDKEFDSLLGIDRDDPAGASGSPVLVTVAARPNYANRRNLTHPRRGASWGW